MRTLAGIVARVILAGVLIAFVLIPVGSWTWDHTFGGDDGGSTQVTQVTQTASPSPTATASATTPSGQQGQTQAQPSFNPVRDYQQSCEPERKEGCSWDVGVEGSKTDMLGRSVVQVGIAKGVRIDWAKGGKLANASPNGRCSLVVLRPNSWFENLHVVDSNVSTYNVDQKDPEGWLKTLAVQAAFEQQSDYGCPAKKFEDIEQWGSPIQSPPCGTPGFTNCAQAQSAQGQPSGTSLQSQQANASCETVDCKPRVATRDTGGQATFTKGDGVYGYRVVAGGQTYTSCFFKEAPADGTVTDGVVHYWPAEAEKSRPCS